MSEKCLICNRKLVYRTAYIDKKYVASLMCPDCVTYYFQRSAQTVHRAKMATRKAYVEARSNAKQCGYYENCGVRIYGPEAYDRPPRPLIPRSLPFGAVDAIQNPETR